MKKSFKLVSVLALASSVFFSSCNKTDDEATPIDTTKPVATVEFSDATNASFSTSVTVSTTGDSAYIALGVNATTTKSTRIYLMKSEDNGVATPVYFAKDLVGKKYDGTGSNYDFDAKTGYTFEIPSGIGNAFKLNIPVALRKGVSAAKSDVYTLWITNGTGDFQNPGKNRVFGGNAIITFKYTNSSLINNYNTVLGNTKDTLGSLFATVDGTNYRRDSADAVTAREASVDFAFVTPNTTDFVFGSLVDATVALKFDLKTFGVKNDTKFAKSTLTKAQFDVIDDEETLLSNLPATITATNVSYSTAPANNVFAFVTAAGKKGFVLVKTATGDKDNAGQASVQVKVQR